MVYKHLTHAKTSYTKERSNPPLFLMPPFGYPPFKNQNLRSPIEPILWKADQGQTMNILSSFCFKHYKNPSVVDLQTCNSLTIMKESSLSSPTNPGVPILFCTRDMILEFNTSSFVLESYQACI